MLAVACANVYGGCTTMARRDAVVQTYQFDPECSQWLTASKSCISFQHSLQTLGHYSHRLCLQSSRFQTLHCDN